MTKHGYDEGAFTVNVMLSSVVEVWAWTRGEDERIRRPLWDAERRRPSHADKRKAVQSEILRREIQVVVRQRTKRERFQECAMRLLHLAA